MERSYFRAVKDAFAADLDTSLNALGVEQAKGGKGDWKAIHCPCCSDSDGSCSISIQSGHIRCHQCSRKLDLFEWWRESHGCDDDWTACKEIGERLNVAFPKQTKGRRAAAPRMTPKLLDQCTQDLFEAEAAAPLRKFLKDRGVWHPQILARFGVGFLAGAIIFAQFTPTGEIRDRYRIYNPFSKVKWQWSRVGTGAPVGFWPAVNEMPDNAVVLLCEGEMDCLSAWIKMELHKLDVPIVAFTWTGGAGSPLASGLMPEKWRGRKIYVCYDNDTWQGPDFDKARAPTPKKLRDMGRRRVNLLDGVVRPLTMNKCPVTLLHVTLDPIDNFGGDLRDWCDAGKTFDELDQCESTDIVHREEVPIEVTHEQAFHSAGEFVHLEGSVGVIEQHSLTVPIVSRIDCPMDTKACCKECPVSVRFREKEINWSMHREHLMNALMSRDPERHLITNMLQKPGKCNECRIEHEETRIGSYWVALPDEEKGGIAQLHIVSMDAPELSGSVGITGYAHYTKKSVGIFATKLESMDKPDANLETHHHDLLQLCPWSSNDAGVIDRYLEAMVEDYSHNITQIYGRPEFHIGTMLVAHSALWYELEGHRYRGWLDACFFGDTRQAKSETVKRLFSYWRLGTAFTCMENFSRAGLTVGGAENGSTMKPGLFPKNNRKMLFLDEFHHMTGGQTDKNVMVHLQSARDEGKVSALKVYGDLKLPAACRLITAGNWANRSKNTYQYFCQHLQSFYGVPEALSRMDWAWCVSDRAKMLKRDVEHQWKPELARALILRAWAMEPHQIHTPDECVEYAKSIALEWDAHYAADDLALHTGVEKYHSIIRTAVSCANMCYSHPDGRENECQVRLEHVKWAIGWILRCWGNLQYDEFSASRISARTLTHKHRVEAALTCWTSLSDPDEAITILSRLTEANSPRSLQSLILGSGKIEEPKHYYKWLATMLRHRGLYERSENQHNTFYLPSDGCLKILHGLIALAKDDPEAYIERAKRIERWSDSPESQTNLPGISSEPDVDDFEDEERYDDVPF